MLFGIQHEIVQVAEAVDHDVQSRQAAEADHERAQELMQQVTVDDSHDGGGTPLGRED